MLAFLVDLQRSIHSGLSADLTAFSVDRNWQALLATLPLGIVFGAAHALTPGHSKTVLASYVLGSDLRPLRAILASFALSVTHVSSAVILALVANTLVTRTLVGAGRAPDIELASRLMLAAIGVWLVVRPFLKRPHVHGEGIAVGAVAGLIPCPLTLFVMTYAASRGIPEAGLAFSVSMLLGVATILGMVALTASVFRGWLMQFLAGNDVALARASRGLDIVAGVSLTSFALLELAQ